MDYVTHLNREDPSVATRPKYPGLKFTDPVKYWDFHVYYEADTKAESEALRHRVVAEFPEEASEGSIIVKKLPNDDAIGPHYLAFWEVDVVRVDVFARLVSWFSLNHGNLSVLIHPQTGDDLKDHTVHGLWLGERKPLKTHVFAKQPSGEVPEFGVKGGSRVKLEEFDSWVTKFQEF